MLKTVTTKIYTCDLCGTENITPFLVLKQNVGYSGMEIKKLSLTVDLIIPYSSGPHHCCQACVIDALKKYIDGQEIPF